ncbi:MAG TPA: hypothetical protein VKT73_10825 [Xanthobacteraceae bacterium]|nr:hypothetical protein [Xanthobacteraceae bacterium]
MRIASIAALATAFAVFASSLPANADINNNRPRTRIIIKKRSFLDAGTEVKPGTARYTNYISIINNRFPEYGPPNDNLNSRFPLPGMFELPGYPRY